MSHGPIKAAYLSYYRIGAAVRPPVLDVLEHTELNGVVIDVKDNDGFIPQETRVPLAVQAGERKPVRVKDFDALLGRLRARGVYTIGRIVVFMDDVLARYRPAWAVVDARTGGTWRDRGQAAWIDAFREGSWDYAIGVAGEAALKASTRSSSTISAFRATASSGMRGTLIRARRPHASARSRGFSSAREALRGTGAAFAIDVFGYTAFNEDDTDVGQRIEDLAPLVDYLCPMTYPSSYHRGVPGYSNPVAHPYEVVFESVRLMHDFRDYAFDRRRLSPSQAHAEMGAAEDAGAIGWMLWNPGNRYTADALSRAAP